MYNEQLENKALAYLFENPEDVTRFDTTYFTDTRATLFDALCKAIQEYETVTLEGVARFTKLSLEPFTLPSPVSIDPVYDELRNLKRKRRYLDASTLLQEAAQTGKRINVSDLLDEETDADDAIDTGLHGVNYLSEIKSKIAGEYRFVSTGIPFLDRFMGGEWPRRRLSIIIANPGAGKTALVCDSMLFMATHDNPSLLFSLEMSKHELKERWLANLCSIDGAKLALGEITAEQEQLIAEKQEYLDRLPLYVTDRTDLTIDQMYPLIRKYVLKYGVKVVFIDHLQLIPVGENKNTELGRVTRILKNLAKKLDIHICILSQMNSKDGVWSIRDTGEAPANTDIVISLTVTDDDGTEKTVEIEFRKNRSGRTGRSIARFIGAYQRYVKGSE